jgi:DNA replication protein DnaC
MIGESPVSKTSSARTSWRSSTNRDGTRSTIITSQLPADRWHEYLRDPIIADAILDRVVHRAHRLTLGGPSRRKSDGNGSSAPTAKGNA